MKQKYYEQVFSYLGDAIVMADEDSRVLFCNEAFSKMFEYPAEDIIGKPLSNLMETHMSADHPDQLKAYLNSDEAPKVMSSRATTMLCYTQSGRAFPARISIARLSSSNGNIGLAIVHDISHHEREKQALETLARTDSLTSLLNRTYLDEILNNPGNLSGGDEGFGILFIDLKDFKQVNDQHGHAIGDSILKIIGLRIKNAVRDSDLAFRYGGDEFVVFAMKVNTHENLLHLSQKVRESLACTVHVEGTKLTVSCTIGISLYPQDAQNLGDAIHLADTDMYRHK